MENFLQDNEGTILFVGMVMTLIIAAVFELLFPRRQDTANTSTRWVNNIGLSVINLVNISWVSGIVAIALAWWGEEENVGLLRQMELGFWPSLLIAILCFEFIAYWFHRALHSIPWLWRIHAVHHSDTDLDFTTSYRNHPVELYVNAPLTIPVILLFGFPVAVVITYQLLKTSISILAHSNIHLPETADRFMRYLVVTPDYHRLHHNSDKHYTDSNFSAAFPLYDYLFGTATNKSFDDHPSMELGLSYFREPSEGRLDRLLLMPFVWKGKQKQETSVQPESA